LEPLRNFFKHIAAKPQVLTIAVENARLKPGLVERIVGGFVSEGDVTYFDYDLQFSSFLQNSSERLFSEWTSKGLLVVQPNDDPMNIIVSFSSPAKVRSGGTFILDSINSFQNLLSRNGSIQSAKTANYRSSVLLSMLELIARSFGKSLIVFDLTKLRPRVQQDQSISWEKELVGGRMIKYKSDTIYLASEMKDFSPDKLGIGTKKVQLRDWNAGSNSESYWVDL
jgi:hypothetical protein